MPDSPQLTVTPRTVKGFRDILPHQVVARRRMIDTIRAAFERYGFVPLDTPAVEYVDALLGLGEEGTKNLFRMPSPEGEEILRAVAPVVLGSLLPPDGSAREQALAAGMASLDDYLAHLSPPLQEEARDVFATLDLLPARVLLAGTWSRRF